VEQEDFSNVSLRKGRKMDKHRKIVWASLVVVALLIGLTAFSGCKKKSAPAAAPATNKAASMDIMQKTCPVEGNPINKDVFVEYKGKKVYFCCADCKAAFDKDPEKYVAKLPQFK